jgi:endonuclease YncB( thermonuclease family)
MSQVSQTLIDCTPESVKKLGFKGEDFAVKVFKIYDGDTVSAVFMREGQLYKFNFRLKGMDTAEISRTKNEDEVAHGKRARAYLEELLLNKITHVVCDGFGKWPRLLGTFYKSKEAMENGEESINDHMIECGLAYKYSGKGARLKFFEWQPEAFIREKIYHDKS